MLRPCRPPRRLARLRPPALPPLLVSSPIPCSRSNAFRKSSGGVFDDGSGVGIWDRESHCRSCAHPGGGPLALDDQHDPNLVETSSTWCSQLTFIIAEACLLAGSVRNAYHTRYRTLFVNGPPSCQTLRKGVFGAGAAFVFFTAIISEFYYLSYAKARDSGVPSYESSVGMGAYR
ncbi:hypothetical protein Taro_026195 [Colocasia esculenta]|uniref:Fiber protein Fb34 n=1 Tax=Colocasia esculenta TaxID=4460 RepID=A0A843VGG7_COLES|nr:hypothetical protein [Colocasia esculenta]